MIENLDEKNGFIINILDNIDSQIKDELGNNHFSFLPFPLNASIIKIPIFKKCEENFICIALYEYDFKNKLIIDKENLYDAKSIPIEELKDYNKNNTYYKKLFNYLEKYIYRCVVERYSKKAYSEYFEKLSLILTFNLKELYSQIIPDKKISTDFFSLQNSTEWAEEDYFHTIPDDVLKYALWINENTSIILRQQKNNTADVIVDSKILDLCNWEIGKSLYDMEDILKAIENNGILPDGKNLIRDWNEKWMTWANVNNICAGCHYSRCPKRMAAYIKHLKDTGTLNEKLQLRDEYREKEQTNSFFSFEWKPENGLKHISQDVFDIAYELVKNNYVNVGRTLNENGLINIFNAFPCFSYSHYSDIDTLSTDFNGEWWVFERDPYLPIDTCDTYTCRLSNCPKCVAGYIYYLIKSGQSNVIKEDREYYEKYSESILTDAKKANANKLKEIQNQFTEKIELLTNDYKDKITNLNILLDVLQDITRNNLYCIIEGERGLGQIELVQNISNVLLTSNKISETIKMPLQNLYSSLTCYDDGLLNKISYTLLEKNKLYVITGIEEFIKDYKTFKDLSGITPHEEIRLKQIEHILKLLGRIESDTYVIILGEKKPINDFLNLSLKIKNMYQECHLLLNNLTIDEIYKEYKKNIKVELVKLLKNNEENFKKEFFEYISINRVALPFNNIELAEYLALYSNSKNNLVLPKNIYSKKTIDESLANIIGLANIKKKLKEMESYMLFRNKAEGMGLKLDNINMHMIFTGNPGCGKTTIARIMAKMLFDIGVLSENKLIEVDRKDLIGEYIGQTAPKTMKVIDKAMGGVLFIDEAYSLTPKDKDKDYGQEAIATLIKAMEDSKGKFVVIFAGYKEEMKTFVESNSGIASRIGYNFDFPDYTADELTEIFKIKLKNSGFNLTQEAENKSKVIMQYFCNVDNIGNGRFVDKIIQETLVKHSISNDDIITIPETALPSIQEIINIIFNNSNMINPEDISKDALKKTAAHEIGHAAVKYLLFAKPGIKKITVKIEGTGTLGYVLFEDKECFTQSKSVLLNRIKTLLGGMACEEIFFGEFENGNTSDLETATNIAKDMVTKYGMSSLGLGRINNSDNELSQIILTEVNKILGECYNSTLELIKNNKSKIDKVIKYLIKNKEITEEEFINNFNK